MSKRNNMKYGLRWQILKRDNFTCQYCGQYAPNVQLEVDHKIEVSNGGADNPDNLVTSCWACNRGKEHLRIYQGKGKIPIHRADRQNEIMGIITQENGITTKELIERISIQRSNADVALYRLKEKRQITRKGRKWYPCAS